MILDNELNIRISGYLPSCIREYLQINKNLSIPATHESTCVTLFADVSGFTAMTESLAERGPFGAECLGKYLNSYFEQMLRLISSAGGDVFKFAGDAMIVLWNQKKFDEIEILSRRAIQCALRIQDHLHQANLAKDITLSVKMGIGIGKVRFLHLGGEDDGINSRIEYIAVGPSLSQAFSSENHAKPGQVICSTEVWKYTHPYCQGTAIENDFFHLHNVLKPIKLCSRKLSSFNDDSKFLSKVKQYVPQTVLPFVSAREESWGSELRDLTILFINLGLNEKNLEEITTNIDSVSFLQKAFTIVQHCIYTYEGTINKFLIDDKGSTVIAAFGLPSISHENDAIRGILASLAICGKLTKIGLHPSIGITTGTAFCGIVGHQGNRREYTILGDVVNLAARLMQRSKLENGGVITDDITKLKAEAILLFETRPEIIVKGKNNRIKIHRPYPKMSTIVKSLKLNNCFSKQIMSLKNVMENMYLVQNERAYKKLFPSLKIDNSDIKNGIYEDYGATFEESREDIFRSFHLLDIEKEPICCIIESDVGLGKTRLLSSIISNFQLTDEHLNPVSLLKNSSSSSPLKKCKLFFGITNPFPNLSSSYNQFDIWKILLSNEKLSYEKRDLWTNYIDTLLNDVNLNKNNIFFRSIFQRKYLLNSIINTTFEEKESDIVSNQNLIGCTIENWFLNYLKFKYHKQDESFQIKNNVKNTYSYNIKLEKQLENKIIGILLLMIFYSFTRKYSTIIIIDNVMFLKQISWEIIKIMSKHLNNCLLILTTRSLSLKSEYTNCSSKFFKYLNEMKNVPTTKVFVLQPLTPLHTDKLAQHILKINKIPPELVSLLISKSQGNPLFLHEIIATMLAREEIFLDPITHKCLNLSQEAWKDKSAVICCYHCRYKFKAYKEKKRCKSCGFTFCEKCTPLACYRTLIGSLSHESLRHCVDCYNASSSRRSSSDNNCKNNTNTNTSSSISSYKASPLKNRMVLRPPSTVKIILLSWLDRLSARQRMILKTASVIGTSFDLDVVRGAYPIDDHLAKFNDDIEELIKLKMIQLCDPSIDGKINKYQKYQKYEFSHGFMVDVIRSQMLSGQLDRLYQKINDYRELREKKLRQEFFQKSNNSILSIMSKSDSINSSSSSSSFSSASTDTISLFQLSHLQLKSGPIQVRKQQKKSLIIKAFPWKKRFAILQNTRLVIQYDPIYNPQKSTILYLKDARIKLNDDPKYIKKNICCFNLYVQSWKRGNDDIVNIPKTVLISVSNSNEMENWMYLIKYSIETVSSSNSSSLPNNSSITNTSPRKNAIKPKSPV